MSELKYLPNYLQVSDVSLPKINDLEIEDDSLSLEEILNCSSNKNKTLHSNNIWCKKVSCKNYGCVDSSVKTTLPVFDSTDLKNLLNMPFTSIVSEPKSDSEFFSDLLTNINKESAETVKKIRSDSNNSDQSDSGIDVSDLYSSSEEQKNDSDGHDEIVPGDIQFDLSNNSSVGNNSYENSSVDAHKIKYSCDTNLSDLLSSICFDEEVDNVNPCVDDSKGSLLNGFDLSDLIDYSVVDSKTKFRSHSLNETNEGEISLATLAKEHLSTNPPKMNKVANESDISIVSEPKSDSDVSSALLSNINNESNDPVANFENNLNYPCETVKKIRSDSDQSDSGIDVSELYSSSEDQKGDSDEHDEIISGDDICCDPLNNSIVENNVHQNSSVDAYKIKYSCDSNLSDLLSSICFDEEVDNINSCVDDPKASLLNGFDLSDLMDYSVVDSRTKLRTDSLNETNESEISLAILAKEHLSSNQLRTNKVADESEMLNFAGGLHICMDNSEEDISMSDLIAAISITNPLVSTEESISALEKSPLNSLDDHEDSDVDLTSCLKLDKCAETVHNTFNIDKVTLSDDLNLQPVPISLKLFEPIESIEKPRTNYNESLFAKALSCKPKQDKSAVLKVLNMQHKICNQILNPAMPNKQIKPTKERIRQAYNHEYIISSAARRIFGPDNCELL